ncbi:MAG: class I SAM-dependent methyltransferase [Deltaproteobacteria bacterium]|nr:class I SAM-dependent methyltransferase [Deltaproteobacteria bacterium]
MTTTQLSVAGAALPRTTVARERTATALALLLLLAGCTTIKRCSYEGFGRDESQKPEEVVETLDIEPGDQVADLGSGSGYFTFRLADAVGSSGKVYAVEVDESMNEYLAGLVKERGAENVQIVLASPDDPRLPEESIDLLFTSNTFHHIEDRPAYFRRVKRVLAPGGRVAIIDYREDAGWFVSLFGHGTSPDVIEREMKEAGYEVVARPDILEEQTFLVFAPRDGGTEDG